jgi:rhodanese-related sulfurtransferase
MRQFGSPPGVPEITVDQLETALAGGAPVVDVREPDEYEAGHVPGARLIPLGDVVARVGEVPRDRPVYVICQSGQRSGRAAQWYRSQGIDARNVAGGTGAWVMRGKAVVEGNEPG